MDDENAVSPQWHRDFLAELVRQAPIPGDKEGCINQSTARSLTANPEKLKRFLAGCTSMASLEMSEVPMENEALFQPVGVITVRTGKRSFVPRRRFVQGNNDSKALKIDKLNPNFVNWFCREGVTVKNPAGTRKILYSILREESSLREIFDGLGGNTRAETTITEFYSILMGKMILGKQDTGEYSVLLKEGNKANIFYIEDHNGTIRPVCANFFGNGWYLYASHLGDSVKYAPGSRVFYLDSQRQPNVVKSLKSTALLDV